MNTRLHSKYPALAERILASPKAVPRIVSAAARVAVQSAELHATLSDAAIAAVDNGTPLDASIRRGLQELQEQSDNSYLDAQDALGAGEPLPASALAAFRRARALAALLGALEARSGLQLTEVVYEALASSEDEVEARKAIEATI